MPKLPQHIGVVDVGLEGIPLIHEFVVFNLEVSLVPEILQARENLEPASVNPDGI